METLFFAKDATAAAKLGHARGVAMLVCGRAELEVHEYPPARVKRSVAANGRADKAQVAQMIRVILAPLAARVGRRGRARARGDSFAEYNDFRAETMMGSIDLANPVFAVASPAVNGAQTSSSNQVRP